MADFTGLLTNTATWCDNDMTVQDEETADHIRCGKFEDLIQKANKVEFQKEQDKAEYLCITGKDGSMSREKDLTRLRNVQNALKEENLLKELDSTKENLQLKNMDASVAIDGLKNNSAYAAMDLLQNDVVGDADAELTKLREARMLQMRREKVMKEHWRTLGHGMLRLIPDEQTFFKEVRPHERSIVLIHSAGDPEMDPTRNPNCCVALLSKLAAKHLETGIFHLHVEKAMMMLRFLEIPDGGPPVLFILRHGEVICRISRSILCDPALMGSEKKLEKLLKSRDAFGEGKDDDSGDDESDEEDAKFRGRRGAGRRKDSSEDDDSDRDGNAREKRRGNFLFSRR